VAQVNRIRLVLDKIDTRILVMLTAEISLADVLVRVIRGI
jgi:hypothetical protein